MMDKKAWVLLILAIFGLTACATMQSEKGPPLPNDINIIPPAPDLPKDTAAFSGKWAGQFFLKRRFAGTKIILVVEEIHDTWAQVLYSWGENISFGQKAGYFRIRAKVISGVKPEIVIDGAFFKRPGQNLYIRIIDSNTLEGNREINMGAGDAPFTVPMKRIN
jgi:hypothetical protein